MKIKGCPRFRKGRRNKDKERLDWLQRNTASVLHLGGVRSGQVSVVIADGFERAIATSIRRAIDAAIRIERRSRK